jgi:hypothetical protein
MADAIEHKQHLLDLEQIRQRMDARQLDEDVGMNSRHFHRFSYLIRMQNKIFPPTSYYPILDNNNAVSVCEQLSLRQTCSSTFQLR